LIDKEQLFQILVKKFVNESVVRTKIKRKLIFKETMVNLEL
jgi:hypothetical protein